MIIKYITLLLTISFTTQAFSMAPDERLLNAAKVGNSQEIRQALANGANINAIDNNGWTVLAVAIKNEHPKIVKILIDEGADLNAIDNSGCTALIWAAVFEFQDIAKLLIANGAHINAKDHLGNSALTYASSYCCTDMVERLVAGGASLIGLEKYPEYYKSAQDIKNEVEELFKVAANRDIKKLLDYTNTAEGFYKLFNVKPYLLYAKYEDCTLLNLLAGLISGNPNELFRFDVTILLLSEYPQALLIKDKSGYTPVSLAIAKGNHNFLKVLIMAALTDQG